MRRIIDQHHNGPVDHACIEQMEDLSEILKNQMQNTGQAYLAGTSDSIT